MPAFIDMNTFVVRAGPKAVAYGDEWTVCATGIVLLLVGALPVYPYSQSWGPWPGGALGIVLIVVLILLITGRL